MSNPIITDYITTGSEKRGDRVLLAEVDGEQETRGSLIRVLVGSGQATVTLRFNRRQKRGVHYKISVTKEGS